MEILFEDNHLLIVNKPGGVASQSTKQGSDSVLSRLTADRDHPVLLTHRLDQPATGVMLFAKTKEAQALVNEQLKNGNMVKKYWAVVKNKPEEEHATLIHYLRKDGASNRSKAFVKEVAHSKKAELTYYLINQSDHYFLLEIILKTGRHHQIRSQLSAIGSPIKGDLKYGFKRSNPGGFIHLHARSLEFLHPISQENVSIQALPPEDNLWKFMLNIS